MSYTWTNGEVITADKLNNTGGGGYDLVITCAVRPDYSPSLSDFIIADGTLQNVEQKMLNGEPVNATVRFTIPYGNSCYQYVYTCDLIDFAYSYMSFVCPSLSSNSYRRLELSINNYALSGVSFSAL